MWYFYLNKKFLLQEQNSQEEMMGVKKGVSLLISIVLIISLTGCDKTTQAIELTVEETEEQQTGTEEQQTETDAGDTEKNVENVNLLENGDFTKGSEHWGTFISKGGVAEFTVADGVGIVDIGSCGSTEYAVQLYYDGFPLKMGGVYEFSFDISSSVERNLEARIQINGGDYGAYIDELVDISKEMKTYTYSFKMEDGNDPAPRMCFNFGTPVGGSAYDAHTIKIDNVSLKITDGSQIVEAVVVDNSVDCNTNQVGYLPTARKTVVIRSENPMTEFCILDEKKTEVYKGTLSEKVVSENAGETVYFGDFSDFKETGTFTIVSKEDASSYPFTIANQVYDDLLKDSFRMLYLQRCGMELTSDLAGDFAHPSCHNEKATIYGTDIKKDVSGGWHDAGDYGRYVVTGAETVEDLLLSYEDNKDVWNGENADHFDIPESGNGIPDLLDEARYELDWLLKMQDEESGGVYHKVTCKEFPGFVMPQEETEELVLSPISTAATGDFAAIMAKSSSVYMELDPDFSKSCLEAAIKAWNYLEKNDNVSGFHNPEDIVTGEYPDGQDKDERFWASVELFKVTGDDKYKNFMEEIMEKYILHGFGWTEVGSYGNIAYLTMKEESKNPVYEKKMKDEIIKKADKLLANAKEDGYHVSLGNNYVWGSNMVVSNNARLLLLANNITKNEEYQTYAYDQLTYLLGQNALSYCFLTGYGSVSPEHAHHRPSIAVGSVLNGMVVGGPDSALEDPFVKSTMVDVAPAKCYIDNEQSYSTNEVTIYWNSPFIYLLSSQISMNE